MAAPVVAVPRVELYGVGNQSNYQVENYDRNKLFSFGKIITDKLTKIGVDPGQTVGDLIVKFPNFQALFNEFKNLKVNMNNYNKQLFKQIYEARPDPGHNLPNFQTQNAHDSIKLITQNTSIPIQPTPEFSQDKQNLTIDSIGANQNIYSTLIHTKSNHQETNPYDLKVAIGGVPSFSKDEILNESNRTDDSKPQNEVSFIPTTLQNSSEIVNTLVTKAEINNTQYKTDSLYEKSESKSASQQPQSQRGEEYQNESSQSNIASNKVSDQKLDQKEQSKLPIRGNVNRKRSNDDFNFALEQIQPQLQNSFLGARPDQNLVNAQNTIDDSYLDYVPDMKKKMKMDLLYNVGIDPSIKQWKKFNDKSHEIDYANPIEMQKYLQQGILMKNVESTSYFPPLYRGNNLSNGKTFGTFAKSYSKELKTIQDEANKKVKTENSGDINIPEQIMDKSWVYKNRYSIKPYSNTFITTKSYDKPVFTTQFPPTNLATINL